MSAQIEKLTDRNAEPVPEIVEIIEELLEKAKAGELREIAVCGSLTGNRYYRASKFDDSLTLLGSIEIMKASVVEGLGKAHLE